MEITERIKTISGLQEFLFWVASVNKNKICELTRVAGYTIEVDNEHIIIFLPKQLFEIIEPTLEADSKISFLMASILNFESYQIKGKYVSHQMCTEENVNLYQPKVLKIIEILSGMGLDGDGIFGYLLDQPSIAVRMRFTEVYEQTPKPGTGGKLTD
ncbi:hypothetical protein JM83_1914 [Gillisia sp. Hel_I_86]|uniref:hypothetical protein n=1 Tax=Gillisia sp. Hel_I_86 TaxID=1249981 RepID=UPI00119B5C51|nr:hypothetical protein [Gillisia sp. Hel_I_86]TVZ26915.1 hypothetical protein JM83_1914 [Gillisia sp. Hel_I_86]